MPIRPKPANLPWIVKTDYNIPGQGRRVVSTFYHSPVWRKFRKKFINSTSTHLGTVQPHSNAICIDCAKRGIVTKTHTVDHIKPINPANAYDTQGGLYGHPLEWTNCQPLCESCHAKKSARERNK